MDQLVVSTYLLAVIFLVVAFAYSAVGLGGGASYAALLAVFGASHVAIPTVTLVLALATTAVGSFNFIRRGHARMGLLLPFLVTSVPMSYVGGCLQVPKTVFVWILLLSLVVVALRIYVWSEVASRRKLGRPQIIGIALVVGAVLGLISGIVGIGGGIYLVPVIIYFGLGSQKEAATCGGLFIFVNSAAALAGRFQHHSIDLDALLVLVGAVVVGGFLGSQLGSTRLSPRQLEKWLGVIVLVAIALLARNAIWPPATG